MTELIKSLQDPKVRYLELILLIPKNLEYVFQPSKLTIKDSDLRILANSISLIPIFRESALEKLGESESVIYGINSKIDEKLATESYRSVMSLLNILDPKIKLLITKNFTKTIEDSLTKQLINISLELPELKHNRIKLEIKVIEDSKLHELVVEYIPFIVTPSLEFAVWVSKGLYHPPEFQGELIVRHPLIVIDDSEAYAELVARSKKAITYTRIYFKTPSNVLLESIVFPNKKLKIRVPMHIRLLYRKRVVV